MKKFLAGVVVGFSITGAGAALATMEPIRAYVNTNGKLYGYVVQDAQGRTVCYEPMVWNQFRGPTSYINCQ
ncbi:hypothetical protein [Roseivivax sp. THAF30]|uniref:hypothetical protein n=1 Tax=Roseivivax sp. THAF30 TaxID=2587852 RepID=UPI001268E8AC|nr:hypothetical protein [Roseivivax sp. THAF30]QFT62561.1 hypothetical protein FIU91_06455 [Roseivivax sp. THAF30]